MVDAGRQRYATAGYRWLGGSLTREGEIVGASLDDLPRLIDERTLICGDLDADTRERLRAMLGERLILASPAASLRRPAVLAQLAWQRFSAGESGRPAVLEPLYLRR
jgi:tRNA threonylcarbamoyladenosine biosynthesis protein TsaB